MILKRKNIWLFIFIDTSVITLSLIFSYLLRFDFIIPKELFQGATYFFVVSLFSKLAVNVALNVYSGLWRYTSFNDLLNILKASTAGTILTAALGLMVLGFFSKLLKSEPALQNIGISAHLSVQSKKPLCKLARYVFFDAGKLHGPDQLQ